MHGALREFRTGSGHKIARHRKLRASFGMAEHNRTMTEGPTAAPPWAASSHRNGGVSTRDGRTGRAWLPLSRPQRGEQAGALLDDFRDLEHGLVGEGDVQRLGGLEIHDEVE